MTGLSAVAALWGPQISQKPESDLHVEHDAARSELSLYTIPDNIVLHQVRIHWGVGARLFRVSGA